MSSDTTLFLANHFNQAGEYDQAIAVAQHALALTTAGGEVVLQALANQYLEPNNVSPRRRQRRERALDVENHSLLLCSRGVIEKIGMK